MKTIKSSGRGEKNIVKKSSFIATIYRVKTSHEAEEYYAKTINEFKKATHNAYAYRIGNPVKWEESSDDGEVKGCAGIPIMNILRSKEITNILVVITRFYGGIKLGPAGLIRSYSQSVIDLIEKIGLTDLD